MPNNMMLFQNGGYTPPSASIDAYDLLYYFIPQRSDKDDTSKNPKPPCNTYTPYNE
jgi:hypothetical protein